MNRTKVGVLGIGAIGSLISYLLRSNKEIELAFYNRSIKNDIHLKFLEDEINFPISIDNDLKKAVELDWLIICLKEHHYKYAKHWFKNVISPKTKVAIIRNGLNLKAPILDYTAEKNILECIIEAPTQAISINHYEVLAKPIITLPQLQLAKSFSELFKSDNIQIKYTDDFKTASWKKISEASALGAILCLTGETCRVFKYKKLRTLYIEILKETMKVAKADGAIFNDGYIEEMLQKLDNYSPNKGSSMLTDRLNGNPIEINAKNGIISKMGKKHNIRTPLNDTLVTLLKFVNHRNF